MVAFLQARLDEDERYLRAMIQAATRAGTALTPAAMSGAYDTALALAEDPQIRRYLAQALDGTLTPPSDLHRLLAGVAAGKARVALYLAAPATARTSRCGTRCTRCSGMTRRRTAATRTTTQPGLRKAGREHGLPSLVAPDQRAPEGKGEQAHGSGHGKADLTG